MDYETSVKEKVIEFINQTKLFTSVDIANAVKNDGLWVRNREVRDWLHENFNDQTIFNGYTTSMVKVCNNTSNATLYHPVSIDPSAYVETNQRSLTPDEVKAIAKANIGKTKASHTPDLKTMLKTPSFDDEDDNSKPEMVIVIRSIARIKIPGAMIRKLGWVPGQAIDPALIQTAKVLPSGLFVNSDYRVSIPRSAVPWGTNPVKVILKNGKIHFEKAKK